MDKKKPAGISYGLEPADNQKNAATTDAARAQKIIAVLELLRDVFGCAASFAHKMNEEPEARKEVPHHGSSRKQR